MSFRKVLFRVSIGATIVATVSVVAALAGVATIGGVHFYAAIIAFVSGLIFTVLPSRQEDDRAQSWATAIVLCWLLWLAYWGYWWMWFSAWSEFSLPD